MRSRIIWLVLFVSGAYYLAQWLLSGTSWSIDASLGIVSNSIVVVGAFAVGLGIINVFRTHLTAILNRKRNWGYSIVVFGAFALVAAFYAQRLYARRVLGLPPETKDAVDFFIDYMNMPLAATVMALLAFYITYAAYRAFKIRSAEAAVMSIVAVICILGHDPVGNLLTRFLAETSMERAQLPVLAQFMMNVVNTAVFRALNLGIAVATIAMAWRIWLGLERDIIAEPRSEDEE
jgi:hypothetical protein